MIAVETIIRKLVGEYEFVIIPGFGALLSHQIPAAYDTSSGLFSPPVKKLAFNEFLKLDDGFLANYISRNQQLTHAEAVEYVRKYTDQLRSRLEKDGRARIAGIGEFSKNVEGKLVFEPSTEKYFKDEWYGFQKIKVQEFKARPTVALQNEKYVPKEAAEVLEAEEEKTTVIKWSNWAAAAVIAGLLCGLSFFLVNSRADIKSTLNPFTELFASKSLPSAPEKEVKTIKATRKAAEMPVAVVPEVVKVAAPDSAAAVTNTEVAVKPIVKEEAVTAKPVSAIPADARFYVIAGAFKGARQAGILLKELQAKGFTETIIIPADKYSKKVKVAVSGFDNESDAYRASAKLKTVIGEAGWVYKKR
ncbi:HU domain-containing protein [Dyadobacter sediminis]|uniref:SPOR domain-containing protein n=1 Tax=Dyadobacter sediminis TaxID=1493691 RepID=A0A5R9KJ41_9BACT|nr:SPOR domain-containing protein [Dyadobacter sediminis]TLU96231.1 SPOR domain-containing protein [Dyadobacter sediminis]GGB80408.1 cell division protein [Dyadobacter sediminis]